MNINRASMLEYAGGQIRERIDEELDKVIDNLMDPDCDPNSARSITLKVIFKRHEKTGEYIVAAIAGSKLAPKLTGTTVWFETDQNGVLSMVEGGMVPGGQIGMEDAMHE